jgi:tetratricopeptide (TPR) repeat protein
LKAPRDRASDVLEQAIAPGQSDWHYMLPTRLSPEIEISGCYCLFSRPYCFCLPFGGLLLMGAGPMWGKILIASALLMWTNATPAAAQSGMIACLSPPPKTTVDQNIKACDDFIDAFPDSQELDTANALVARGELYRGKGQYDRALKDYDQAVKIQPSDPDVLNARCYARALRGQLEPALADCNAALNSNTEFWPLDQLLNRGYVNAKLGRFDDAIADYTAAFKLKPLQKWNRPDTASALYGRGMTRRKKGDTAGGDADIAAATAVKRNIAPLFAKRWSTI